MSTRGVPAAAAVRGLCGESRGRRRRRGSGAGQRDAGWKEEGKKEGAGPAPGVRVCGGRGAGRGCLRGNARAREGREGREGVNAGGRGRGRREGRGDFFIINLFSGPLWLRGGRPGGEEGGRQQRYGGDSGGCCCRRCRREAEGPARRPFKLARAAGPAGPSLAASPAAEGALCAGPSAALARCRRAGERGRGAKGGRAAAPGAVSVPALPAASERPRLG